VSGARRQRRVSGAVCPRSVVDHRPADPGLLRALGEYDLWGTATGTRPTLYAQSALTVPVRRPTSAGRLETAALAGGLGRVMVRPGLGPLVVSAGWPQERRTEPIGRPFRQRRAPRSAGCSRCALDGPGALERASGDPSASSSHVPTYGLAPDPTFALILAERRSSDYRAAQWVGGRTSRCPGRLRCPRPARRGGPSLSASPAPPLIGTAAPRGEPCRRRGRYPLLRRRARTSGRGAACPDSCSAPPSRGDRPL